MIPGVTIVMGGIDWVVPPLTLGQLRRLASTISAVDGADREVAISAMIRIVTEAMSRNYPEITDEAVSELLDLGNTRDVVSAVLANSGLRQGGAGKGPGESAAVTTGPTSTASSPPPADTRLLQ
jgi:hypothetical protein